MTKNEIIKMFLKKANNKKTGYSEDTTNTYMTYINKYLDWLKKDILDTNSGDVEDFMSLYDTKSDKTYNLVLSAITSLYDVFCMRELMEKNPCEKVESISKPKSKEKKSISKEDYLALLNNCKNTRDTAIITLLMNTGMRVHELENLTLEQYLNRDEDNAITLIVTKGSKIRTIYLNDNVIEAIENYLPNRKEGCEFLFVSNYGNKMSTSCIWRTIKTIGKRANLDDDVLDGLSAHSFRHSTITNMINNGVDITVIATIVGHSSVNTTMGYADREKLNIKNAMMNM